MRSILKKRRYYRSCKSQELSATRTKVAPRVTRSLHFCPELVPGTLSTPQAGYTAQEFWDYVTGKKRWKTMAYVRIRSAYASRSSPGLWERGSRTSYIHGLQLGTRYPLCTVDYCAPLAAHDLYLTDLTDHDLQLMYNRIPGRSSTVVIPHLTLRYAVQDLH